MGSSGEQANNLVQSMAVVVGAVHALTFDQRISLCFLLIGAASFLVNWHYKHKEFKQKETRSPAGFKKPG